MSRIDAHTHVGSDRLIPSPSFPDTIKIELTTRCNYQCAFCASSKNLRPHGDMPKEFLYRILAEAKSIGVREIGMFLLGESLLVRDLAEYVAYAKKTVGIEYVFLTTNGYLASPEKMIPILEAGLDSIKFSVNAGSPERYKSMHGVDGFARVIKNIKWLNSYRKEHNIPIKLSVSAIFDDEVKAELDGLKAMLAPTVDSFYYLPLYNQGGHVVSDSSKLVGNPGRFENQVPPIPCWGLFNSAKISYNGMLTSCYFDHNGDFEIADLNKVSLRDAWADPKFVELRQKHLAGDKPALKDTVCGKCLGLC
jgi:sulfatase maturation enzyme AslB (radical SAM superfamily)